jgi:hypothetical protein
MPQAAQLAVVPEPMPKGQGMCVQGKSPVHNSRNLENSASTESSLTRSQQMEISV